MLRSEEMLMKVKLAMVMPLKEVTSDTKVAWKGLLVKPKNFDSTTPGLSASS